MISFIDRIYEVSVYLYLVEDQSCINSNVNND
jgi:hypothetical protein